MPQSTLLAFLRVPKPSEQDILGAKHWHAKQTFFKALESALLSRSSWAGSRKWETQNPPLPLPKHLSCPPFTQSLETLDLLMTSADIDDDDLEIESMRRTRFAMEQTIVVIRDLWDPRSYDFKSSPKDALEVLVGERLVSFFKHAQRAYDKDLFSVSDSWTEETEDGRNWKREVDGSSWVDALVGDVCKKFGSWI